MIKISAAFLNLVALAYAASLAVSALAVVVAAIFFVGNAALILSGVAWGKESLLGLWLERRKLEEKKRIEVLAKVEG